jgi:hypothetical protein
LRDDESLPYIHILAIQNGEGTVYLCGIAPDQVEVGIVQDSVDEFPRNLLCPSCLIVHEAI